MNYRILGLGLGNIILLFIFILPLYVQQYVNPVWIPNPYFQTKQAIIKSGLTTTFGSANPITKTITFTSTFTIIPQLSFAIKNYRGSDVLIVEYFGLTRTALTTTSFTVYTMIVGTTNLRIVNIVYLAIDKSFPHHINVFNDIKANYPSNLLLNISSGLVGIRTYTNTINYTTLATSIGSAYTRFNPILNQNYILVYLTTLYWNGTTSTPYPIISYQVDTQVISVETFNIKVTVSDGGMIAEIRFSLVIYDSQDILNSGLFQIVYARLSLSALTDQYYSIPRQFATGTFIGLLDFVAPTSRAGLEFNWENDLTNDRVIFNASVPYSSSATSGLSSYTANVFYVKTWQCPAGYQYNLLISLCGINCMLTGCCGDGIWMDTFQACEDGNLDNNDGCDSTCQVQVDYQCLLADKLPSGLSLCKYTKDITVQFTHLQKQLSANIVHLFFTLGPSNFKGWSQAVIQSMLSPIQIVDNATGTEKIIPYNSLTFAFQKNLQTDQIEIIIQYDIQSIENQLLKFTIDPSQTSIASINYKTLTSTVYVELTTNKGVSLYNYDKNTYDFQNIMNLLGQVVGCLSLIFLLIGWCLPYGKLIVLEALAVVQIAYFSVLQFQSLPPTYAGLKYLGLSNGFNDLTVIGFEFSSQQSNGIIKMMGMKNTFIENYNFSILLFLIPFIVGSVGYLICRSQSQVDNQSNLKDQQKARLSPDNQNKYKNRKALLRLIFIRIFQESSFYGLVVCGYLTWTSIFLSMQKHQTNDIIFSVLTISIWIGLIILFLKDQSYSQYLSRFQSIQNDKQKQIVDQKQKPIVNQKQKDEYKDKVKSIEKNTILKGFGEYKQVYELIQKRKPLKSSFKNKVYLLFVFERILFGVVLIYLSKVFTLIAIVQILKYFVFLIFLLLLNRIHQSRMFRSECKPLFSYLHRNYVLRQGINFLTIILIQILYLSLELMIKKQPKQQVMMNSVLSTKFIPLFILCICLVSLIWNIFLWVWQIKHDRVIIKNKMVIKILFNDCKCLQFFNKSSQQEQKSQTITSKQNKKNILANKNKQLSLIIDQQNYMKNELDFYIKESPIFKSRHSPFIDSRKLFQKNQDQTTQGSKIQKKLNSKLLINDSKILINPIKTQIQTLQKNQNKQSKQKLNEKLLPKQTPIILDNKVKIQSQLTNNIIEDDSSRNIITINNIILKDAI